MPRGFSSKMAKNFIKNTSDAMVKAGEIHNRRPPLAPMGNTPAPRLAEPRNQEPPFSPDDADFTGNHSTGIGNSSNIVVDEALYQETVRKLNAIDDYAGEEIYRMACKIEEICQSMYVVPETIPHITALTAQLKGYLPEFRNLSDDVGIQVRRFADEVGTIDKAPGIFALAISEGGAQQVISETRRAVDRQVMNMQNTARSYDQAAKALGNRADALERQAVSMENRIDTLEGQIRTLKAQAAVPPPLP